MGDADLRAAFPAEPIAAGDAFRTTGYDHADAYLAHLAGRPWPALDPAFLARRADALWFLDASRFAEVLPAYLAWLASSPAGDEANDAVIRVLTAPQPYGGERGLGVRQFAAVVDALTPDQHAVVRARLAAYRDRCDPEEVCRYRAQLAVDSW